MRVGILAIGAVRFAVDIAQSRPGPIGDRTNRGKALRRGSPSQGIVKLAKVRVRWSGAPNFATAIEHEAACTSARIWGSNRYRCIHNELIGARQWAVRPGAIGTDFCAQLLFFKRRFPRGVQSIPSKAAKRSRASVSTVSGARPACWIGRFSQEMLRG